MAFLDKKNKRLLVIIIMLILINTALFLVESGRFTGAISYLAEVITGKDVSGAGENSSNDQGKVDGEIIKYPNNKDLSAPAIFILFPAANSEFKVSETINFVFYIEDNVAVDTATASVTYPNGDSNQFVLTKAERGMYTAAFTLPELTGRYDLIVTATDASGNAAREKSFFRVVEESKYLSKKPLPEQLVNINGKIKDRHGLPLLATITISGSNKFFDTVYPLNAKRIPPGIYDITITYLLKGPVINITFVNVVIDKDIDELLEFDQNGKSISPLDSRINYNQLFSFNPLLGARYDHIIYTAVADGPELYKCSFFDFEEDRCFGQWLRIRNDLVPGEIYTQKVFPGDPAFGEGSSKIVLRDITIDGNMSDWDAVLSSANNVIADGISGSTDLDVQQVGNSARDLTKFAYTWNETYFFTYFRRISGPPSTPALLVYFDLNDDGYLNSTDKLARITWNGNSQQYDLFISRYVPVGSADIITGDGVDEPGTFTDEQTIEQHIQGGNPDRIDVEVRIPWQKLNVTPGSPIKLHISSAEGSGINLPSQIEDNMGNFSTRISDIDIVPDNSGQAKAFSTKTYSHTITNFGNSNELIDLNFSSTLGFNVTFSFANGTLLTDTNGNGKVDIGLVAPDQMVTIRANISIGNVPSGSKEEKTTIIATASSGATDSSLDTTKLGDITIFPTRSGRAANNTIISYRHTVVSNLATSEFIDITTNSNQGFLISLFYANGTPLTDTNANSKVDIGNVTPGKEVNITVQLKIGNVALGIIDTTTITAKVSSTPSISASVADKTTITGPIEITPNYIRDIGIGFFSFFEHEVFNNQNFSDTIDLNLSSTRAWPMAFYQTDRFTLLSDTDFDSKPDTGVLSGQGGSTKILVKISVPTTAKEPDNNLVTVNGFASASSATAKALDNVTARILIIYNDSARTQQDTVFALGDIVYTTAYSLSDVNTVFFIWIDANGTTVRTSNLTDVDNSKQATDQVTTAIFNTPGTWTLVLTNSKDVELSRTFFQVIEQNPPKVINVLPAAGSEFNLSTIITISANVTDDIKVGTVFAELSLPNLSIIQLPLTDTDNNTIYDGIFLQTDETGIYSVRIIANDTFGNINATETTIFAIVDDSPPQVTALIPTSGSSFNETTTIKIAANVTDNIAVSFVFASITFPNGTQQNITLFPSLGTKYNSSFAIPQLHGQYAVRFIANDTRNNFNSTQTTFFKALQIPISLIAPPSSVIGAQVQIGNSSGALNETNSISNTVQGGSKKELNVTAVVKTSKWQGYFGEVSSTVALGITDEFIFGFGASKDEIKSVFASPGNSFDFGSLRAAAVADVDAIWKFNTNDSDSTSSIFGDSAIVAHVTNVPTIALNAYNAAGGLNQSFYKSGIFTDIASPTSTGDFAFGVDVNVGKRNFLNQSLVDYELIVPVNKSAGSSTQVYYFYLVIE